jgi:hypothetical protein
VDPILEQIATRRAALAEQAERLGKQLAEIEAGDHHGPAGSKGHG